MLTELSANTPYNMFDIHKVSIWLCTFKARTHRPIFRGFAAESAVEPADSIPESANSITDFVVVGRLPVLNMFNIYTLIQSTLVGLVGMGLY